MSQMTSEELTRRLNLALYYARRSPIKSFQTGAVIFDREGLVSAGWAHYSALLTLKKFRSIHAELHATLRAPRERLIGSTVYVGMIRRKSGNVGVARPCENCLSILHEVGVKEAVFTSDEGYSLYSVTTEYERAVA